MLKLGFLLLFAVCMHASCAAKLDFGGAQDTSLGGMLGNMMGKLNHVMKKMHKTVKEVLGRDEAPATSGKPAFCKKYDCPKFTVENKTANFELRCYESAKWVSTTNKGSGRGMFMRLFDYIQGANDRSEKIKMTVPVTTLITPSKTLMSFYIPQSHQASPPSPSDPKVKVITSKPTCYYVRSFSGLTWGGAFKKNAKKLAAALDAAGLQDSYNAPEKMMITAGYDEPWRFLNRHNEVWLMATK